MIKLIAKNIIEYIKQTLSGREYFTVSLSAVEYFSFINKAELHISQTLNVEDSV